MPKSGKPSALVATGAATVAPPCACPAPFAEAAWSCPSPCVSTNVGVNAAVANDTATTPIIDTPITPTNLLIREAATLGLSSPIHAAIAPNSNSAQRVSEKPKASGEPSPPIGTPAVRETIQTAIIAALSTTPKIAAERVGRQSIHPANASCSHAEKAKKSPCDHETPACSPITPKWIPAAAIASKPAVH